MTARRLLLVSVASAVAVAFADSSIVVLGLPEIYARFDTTVESVAWVVTSYNLAVAVGGLALVPLAHRTPARALLAVGALAFVAASVACALAGSIGALVAARAAQGLGGALVLVGSLPVLIALAEGPNGVDRPSRARGVEIWIAAGTFGAALGPALGGVLTQAFDWPAIFLAQAPVAALALVAAAAVRRIPEPGRGGGLGGALPANAALALVSGALVGALFLGVLLVIEVFGYSPIGGALVVSAVPVAAALAHPIASALAPTAAIASGAALLAAGLVELALLPSSALGFTLAALALCGFGLGLAVPALGHSALGGQGVVARTATLTVGIRHLGLVLALALVAPILTNDLRTAAEVATLNGTAVVIDGRIPATTKLPLALDIRDALDRAPEGRVPDLTPVFEAHGASNDPEVRYLRDELAATIVEAATRGFRTSFAVCALLAALALVPVALGRRRFRA